MLYLSQPIGTGFSYSEEAAGSLDPNTGDYVPPSVAPITGGNILPVQKYCFAYPFLSFQ